MFDDVLLKLLSSRFRHLNESLSLFVVPFLHAQRFDLSFTSSSVVL